MIKAKRPVAQFVMKISKYCNLRCTYCYEYNELGNKERMSLDHIARRMRDAISEMSHYDEYDHVIINDDQSMLIPQVMAIHERLLKMESEAKHDK